MVGDEDDSGASAVEYALIVSAIAAVVVLIVITLGTVTNALFDDSCDEFRNQVESKSCPD